MRETVIQRVALLSTYWLKYKLLSFQIELLPAIQKSKEKLILFKDDKKCLLVHAHWIIIICKENKHRPRKMLLCCLVLTKL